MDKSSLRGNSKGMQLRYNRDNIVTEGVSDFVFVNNVEHMFLSFLFYIIPVHCITFHYRRKFRSETSDNTDSWKAEVRRVRREKLRKVAIHCVFPMICGSGGSKSRLAKAAGAEAAGQMRDEKVHAVVARSTFPSQNVQNTPGSDHFWKLRCRKSARRCGAKHISKSKCTKHTSSGPLLEVEMSKKCTPLWREPHFQVKMYKTHQVRTTFGRWDVEKVHAVVAPRTFRSQNVKNTRGSGHFWRLRCRVSKKCTPLWREAYLEVKMLKILGFRTTFGGSDVASPHSTTLHYTTLQYTTLHNTTGCNYNYTTTVHYTPPHSTTLNYTTLHSTTLHYPTLHYTTLHYATLHYITLHSTTLHYTTTTTTQLHSTTLHCTTLQLQLHYTTLYTLH